MSDAFDSREAIACLIPHAGRMCLWQRVVEWNDTRIRLEAFDQGRFLRRARQLDEDIPLEGLSQWIAGRGMAHGELEPHAGDDLDRRHLAGGVLADEG